MCGITGFWTPRPHGMETAAAVARSMAERIIHRGPDGFGVWVDDHGGLALAHRRLAVVDLSEAGHQPMRSASGRFELIFNGEIYNHAALRAELPGTDWRGHSDTETLLAGFEQWGIEGTLKKAIGMFAIALWDRERGRLTLARDRMGEKPLYYGSCGGTFLFASELKAMRAYPGFKPALELGAIALLLRHNYIPAPYSIYQGIRKLLPGTLIHVDGPAVMCEPQAFWSLREVAEYGRRVPFQGTDQEAANALERHLDEAIALQRVADVPLGAFLSGGVDSSTIVALMQRQSSSPVRTFTIGFHEAGYNEAEHAMAVAKHLGTQHTELYVSGQHALDVVPQLATMYCEPFSDSSQIPTFLVSQMAREHVTVSLSGDAGDELFCGYTRYELAPWLWGRIGRIPGPLRRLLAPAIQAMPAAAWDGIGRLLWPMLGRGRLPLSATARLSDRAYKVADMLGSKSSEDFYRYLNSHQAWPDRYVIGGVEPASGMNRPELWPALPTFEERMMFIDQISYLPDDILVKVDRAAMSVSLETRVPMLDHRVVEFAASLPMNLKRRAGVGKWLLRQVLYRHVPQSLIDRPKTGFGVPLGDWLSGPLRPWAEELLDERRLREQGLLDTTRVRRLWLEHVSGARDWKYLLWDVLMLQAWLDTQ
jgi:asparagine synthase (glutamine-hydrolysing)